MPKISFNSLAVLFLVTALTNLTPAHSQSLGTAVIQPGISFTQNKGQVSDQFQHPRPDVLFSGTMGSMLFHLRASGISYQFSRTDSWKQQKSPAKAGLTGTPIIHNVPDQSTIYRLDVNLLESNHHFQIETGLTLPGYNNFYLPVCTAGVRNVQSYSELYFKNVYPGIDLHYYEKDGALKYDYLVAPGADYHRIMLQISGADEIQISTSGELIIKTPFGNITEERPVVFQNGKQLQASWRLKNDVVSFTIQGADPNYELVIDPAVRAWGTYYGSGGEDYGYGVCTDAIGDVYMTGNTTQSSTLIATSGAHQTTIGGGNTNGDAYLVKFNSAGTRLWGTYYGGSDDEIGMSCTTYTNGDVYLVGITGSTTGIATAGSYQTTPDAKAWDAFLVKFDANGQRQWATYYGGESIEIFNSVCVDVMGNVYAGGTIINGSVGTWTALATPGAHQTANGNGYSDGLLVKFSASGIRQWATYYGGTGEDWGNCCVCDKQSNVYLCGTSSSGSSSIISTGGSHQTAIGGSSDAFLVKFNANGQRQWATYYGGTAVEKGNSCAVDTMGNIYLVGETWSAATNVISTPGSHQVTYGSGSDGFLVKFNGAGTRQWGTYYGLNSWESLWSCSTDLTGNVFFCGSSGSAASTVIATPGSHQTTWGGSFLAKFSDGGVRQWGTYYGGTGYRGGYAAACDISGAVYMAGTINSTTGTAVASPGSHQQTYGGGPFDAYLVKFYDCSASQPVSTTPAANQTLCANESATLTALSQVLPTWYLTPTSSTTLATGSAFVTQTLAAGVYTYYVQDLNCPSNPARTPITVTVFSLPVLSTTGSQTIICFGESALLTASGATSYTWSNSGTGSSLVVSPLFITTYTVTGTDLIGCKGSSTVTVQVNTCLGIDNGYATSLSQVYPNPNDGLFTVEITAPSQMIVTNALGEVLIIRQMPSGKNPVELTALPPGIYFLSVSEEHRVKTFKVVRK